MKRLLILAILAVPSIVGGANYDLVSNESRTVENRNGNITVTERTKRFKRIYHFVASHPKASNVLKTTEMIYDCKYPEVMAAIASVESEFDSTAVGSCKEVSAWQILEWELGDPKNNKDGLSAALKVFEQKKVGRTVVQAIKFYNGSGHKAEKYQKKVLAKIQQIKSLKV